MPIRVLLLEDNPDDAMLLETELIAGNLVPQFERVYSRAALQQALNREWDLIVSDYVLPQFDGLEALSMVRAVDAGLPYKLPAQVEITAYRIIQEAITNIVRHAEASQVVVELNGGEEGSELEIIVRDNGRGIDLAVSGARANRSGIGLMGMSERVMLLGGQFNLITQPGTGTRIDVLPPLR